MRCKIAGLLLAGFVVAGCQAGGGSGGGDPVDNGGDPFQPGVAGKAIKVTYIRFNLDPRTKRFVPEYRIMLSDGWRVKNGRSPREPFLKLYKNPFMAGDTGLNLFV